MHAKIITIIDELYQDLKNNNFVIPADWKKWILIIYVFLITVRVFASPACKKIIDEILKIVETFMSAIHIKTFLD
jgi:hypothetical protein